MADIFQPGNFQAWVPPTQPSIADKLGDYLGTIQKNKDAKLERQRKQQGWADEQELRQLQKEMAADFKARPPKDTADMLQRTTQFFMARGKPEVAMKFSQAAEDALARKTQQEADRAAKQQMATDKLSAMGEKNKQALQIAVGRNSNLLLQPAVQQQMGLSPEAANDLFQSMNDNRPMNNRFQFLEKYAGRPEEMNNLIGIINQMDAAKAQIQYGTAAQYGYRPTITDDANRIWEKQPGGGFTPAVPTMPQQMPQQMPMQMQAEPEPMPANGMEIPTLNMPVPALGDNLMPLGQATPGIEGAPMVDPQMAQRAMGVENQLRAPAKASALPKPPKQMEGLSVKQMSDKFMKEPVWKALKDNQIDQEEQGSYNDFVQSVESAPNKTDFQKQQLLNTVGYTRVFKYIRALDKSVVRPSELEGFKGAAYGGGNPKALAARIEAWVKGETVPPEVAANFQKIMEYVGRDLKGLYEKTAADYAKSFLSVQPNFEDAAKFLPQVIGNDPDMAQKILSGGYLMSPNPNRGAASRTSGRQY